MLERRRELRSERSSQEKGKVGPRREEVESALRGPRPQTSPSGSSPQSRSRLGPVTRRLLVRARRRPCRSQNPCPLRKDTTAHSADPGPPRDEKDRVHCRLRPPHRRGVDRRCRGRGRGRGAVLAEMNPTVTDGWEAFDGTLSASRWTSPVMKATQRPPQPRGPEQGWPRREHIRAAGALAKAG